MTLTLWCDSFDTEHGRGYRYTARHQSTGSGTSGAAIETRPRVSAEDPARVLLMCCVGPRADPPGRNVQVPISLYTADHNQQDRTTFNGTQTRPDEQQHISWQSRQMLELRQP